jgi:hypothetical protein
VLGQVNTLQYLGIPGIEYSLASSTSRAAWQAGGMGAGKRVTVPRNSRDRVLPGKFHVQSCLANWRCWPAWRAGGVGASEQATAPRTSRDRVLQASGMLTAALRDGGRPPA